VIDVNQCAAPGELGEPAALEVLANGVENPCDLLLEGRLLFLKGINDESRPLSERRDHPLQDRRTAPSHGCNIHIGICVIMLRDRKTMVGDGGLKRGR
jgi:hypothetical protein